MQIGIIENKLPNVRTNGR